MKNVFTNLSIGIKIKILIIKTVSYIKYLTLLHIYKVAKAIQIQEGSMCDIIQRRFTHKLENTNKTVFDLFEWKQIDVKLVNHATNKTIAEMKDLEFPSGYSQSACDIIATKYFRKKGVPNQRGSEYSMRQLVHRMVNFWVESMLDEKLIEESQRQIVYDELAYMMLNQMFAPNSPQFFNTGLGSYGITGKPQGHFYFDEQKNEVTEAQDPYSRTQGSACFIISILDTLLGERSLTDQITTETLLFKYGSGVGTNWSPIRGKDEALSGGGKSSGLLSFLKVSDRNAGAIKSGGTTRRAAKMNILNLDHPEIMEFINWKAKEEEKVIALGKMGYDTSIEGEAYETVSGQNANNSVRIPDKFMSSLDFMDTYWTTIGRVDGKPTNELSVAQMWDELAKATWSCGDPGVQFDDIINAWHTCPYGEDGKLNAPYNRINASNPCSEYMFLDDTACNLASINLLKFYDEATNSFDLDSYLHTVRMVMLVLEATIHKGLFPTKEIAKKTHYFRTTGIGLTNLGMLLMIMGLPYDSHEARTVSAALTSLMTGCAYYMSAWMAKSVGAFKFYEINKTAMQRVVHNHARAANYLSSDKVFDGLNYKPVIVDHNCLYELGFDDLSQNLRQMWRDTIALGKEHGFRNAQVTVLAPTGTIAFAMDCSTTSSEPFFSHVAYKKLVGGGFMEIINPAIPITLKRLGYADNEIDEIIDYVMAKDENGVLLDGKIEGAPYLKEEHLPIFDTASRCGSGERFISPEAHVRMMGALAPHVTGAISKTVNLPSSATVDEVKEVFRLSWELGVKAIAVYRDGCKVCQPLNASHNKKERLLEDYTYAELLEFIKTKKIVYKPLRVKPSGIRIARVHEAAIDGLKLYVTTSFYEDGRLGEIYVSSGRQGSLTKGLLDSISTTISEMLQYGVPPQDIAKMYRGQKYEPSGFVSGHPYIKFVDSISDLISKIIDIELGNYTYCQVKPKGYDEPDKSGEPIIGTFTQNDYLLWELCPHCKSNKMVKNGTCKVCTECGATTGCS